ncbi:hypothetical protein [Chryseobacterium gambrini]|uniref:Uncharacterized protein n=1 Tax=Chryseobacterium gambrini TaxID=373672 RepID=A0A1N7QZ56_9FLAO|nr:hypothetical protein [Chryseobacterium gambrini]SIT28132.1 hypothetical protein SAMN05421785_1258 [Chryseobacterium gambrini]
MKKSLSLLASFVITMTYSQVGIGTSTPDPNAILDLTATNKALLLPRIVNTDAVASPVNGMVIYDTTLRCVRFYQDNDWTSCMTNTIVPAAVIANCNTSTFTGTYVNGIAMTASNNFSVTITNNTSSAANLVFQTSDLALSGVSGITVTAVSIPSVTLNAGQSQSVGYILGGTPTASGTLTGTWTNAALNCVKTVEVNSPAIASLDCAGATNNGTLTGGTSASGVSSVISYAGGNGSAHAGQTVTSTGVTGLTATLTAGSFASGAGTLTYNITGTPASSGTATFAISIGGKTCNLTRTVSAPISIPAGAGFDNATGCIINGSEASDDALFPSIYNTYASPNGGFVNIDILGDCNTTYGTAWSGTKFIALTIGDAITIDLGSAPAPGSTFTMTIYERKLPTFPTTSYRVGLSTTSGTTGGAGLNNLFNSPGTSATTWTPRTISFTVPASPSNLRYLTIESTGVSGDWLHIDF